MVYHIEEFVYGVFILYWSNEKRLWGFYNICSYGFSTIVPYMGMVMSFRIYLSIYGFYTLIIYLYTKLTQ